MYAQRTALRTILTGIFIIAMTAIAAACPSGQSKGAFGWCYPNVGGTVGQTFEGAKKGDWDTVAKGVGDIVITYNCPSCAIFAQAVMDKKDRAIISTIVGRGVILSAIGVPSELVVADAITGAATAIKLRGQTPAPIPQAPPAERGQKVYRSTTMASCITTGPENMATIGWSAAPTFVERSSGKSSTFPEIDLRKGDIVASNASDCPEYGKLQGQASKTEIAIIYEDNQTVPGTPEQMKYFMWGKITDMKVAAAQ